MSGHEQLSEEPRRGKEGRSTLERGSLFCRSLESVSGTKLWASPGSFEGTQSGLEVETKRAFSRGVATGWITQEAVCIIIVSSHSQCVLRGNNSHRHKNMQTPG
ncbi:unnamed protein product [Pleuronectes platessa]|uniref:Uncharacterized protein n=1 Tax=Pleuronectes platessa TaxID=8262 RepID=A0A9N7YWR7_PLEPL|nr:unnamed protein product [Pleuronectes platessa]